MTFLAMINNQGYLPTIEPLEFDSKKDCVDYLFQMLEEQFDIDMENPDNENHHRKNIMSNYEHAMNRLQKGNACLYGGIYFGVDNNET